MILQDACLYLFHRHKLWERCQDDLIDESVKKMVMTGVCIGLRELAHRKEVSQWCFVFNPEDTPFALVPSSAQPDAHKDWDEFAREWWPRLAPSVPRIGVDENRELYAKQRAGV
jgi:hypothetical protein